MGRRGAGNALIPVLAPTPPNLTGAADIYCYRHVRGPYYSTSCITIYRELVVVQEGYGFCWNLAYCSISTGFFRTRLLLLAPEPTYQHNNRLSICWMTSSGQICQTRDVHPRTYKLTQTESLADPVPSMGRAGGMLPALLLCLVSRYRTVHAARGGRSSAPYGRVNGEVIFHNFCCNEVLGIASINDALVILVG